MKAILMGYERYGGLSHLIELFRLYGYRDITVLTEQPKLLATLRTDSHIHLRYIENTLDPVQVAKAAAQCGASPSKTPFFCAQDRVFLSYLKARALLGIGRRSIFRLPEAGIRRARVKPAARLCWEKHSVEKMFYRTTGRGTQLELLKRLSPNTEYIVKPVFGMGSELVQRCRVDGIPTALRAIRSYFDCHPFKHSPQQRIYIDRVGYNLYRDVLVEEHLSGEEYTVDGYIQNGCVRAVVQHKETRYSELFMGDGLLVSPPDIDIEDRPRRSPARKTTAPSKVSVKVIIEFVTTGLRALGIDDWVFHAEVIATPAGMRFIELNPRPPGGLLWRTAGIHLGIDPFDAALRMFLNIGVERSTDIVTGQFPIYALKTGTLRSVRGIEDARLLDGVDRIQQLIQVGDTIDSLCKENYLAFVSIVAKSHDKIRELERKVRGLIDFDIR